MDIKGKHALVTGGGVGIGLEITRAMTAAGASVLIVGRDEARLRTVQNLTPRVTHFAADLANPAECDRLIAHVLAGSPALDIPFDNAGTMQFLALTAPRRPGSLRA